ncbi:PP2C family protein-serine/threonine phosphatase [Bacteroidota bacterium]
MYSQYDQQRDTYKLVEKLASRNFKHEITLLKSLVKDIVSLKDFEITGGRIWELNPENHEYKLVFQVGNVSKIPQGYSIPISDHPILSKLIKQRTILNYETDKLLRKKGIEIYSVTGVGNIIRLKSGKYYKYALGFNAPEILQSFYETLNIINSVANITLKSLSTQHQQKQIQEDILKASEIQRNLQPEHKLQFHDYDIFGLCMPAHFVGGDYFDYILHSVEEEERLSVLVSDAASSGLPAATQALFLSGAIRLGSTFAPGISKFLVKLNNLIYEKFPFERFVTLFYCELTLSSNRLVLYANAGHCPPIHYRPETDSWQTLNSTGGFLGLLEHQKFGVENIRMHNGDILILYTDGITEARDKGGNLYGEERIVELLRKNYRATPEVIAYAIIENVQKFTKDSNFADDQTLVVIKRDTEK